MNALLVPGPALAAVAWARGQISDTEFIFEFPRVPEAVLFATLPDLDAFRRCVPQLRELSPSILVFRTGTPEVIRHAVKWGAIWTLREPEDIGGKFRYLVPAEKLARYLGRIPQNSAAAAGATTAR